MSICWGVSSFPLSNYWGVLYFLKQTLSLRWVFTGEFCLFVFPKLPSKDLQPLSQKQNTHHTERIHNIAYTAYTENAAYAAYTAHIENKRFWTIPGPKIWFSLGYKSMYKTHEILKFPENTSSRQVNAYNIAYTAYTENASYTAYTAHLVYKHF